MVVVQAAPLVSANVNWELLVIHTETHLRQRVEVNRHRSRLTGTTRMKLQTVYITAATRVPG
jgi:hypothetical protein